MATNNLVLRLAHSTLNEAESQITLTETWEAWQPTIEVVLNTFTKSVPCPVDDGFDEASARLHQRIEYWFGRIQEWHKSRSAIDGFSLFDASNILAWWSFAKNGNKFDLSHPISGDFPEQTVAADGDRPTLKGRIDAILNLVLGPTAWAQANSPSSGTLRVKCVSVNGADHYDVYDDRGGGEFVALGSVPDNSWNDLSVDAGMYRVRMCAVTPSGTKGVLGNQMLVVVE